MAKAKEALNKSALLSALKDPKTGENRTDLTKEALQAELAKKFEFIPEFFSYLYATYLAGGKFTEAEDGTLTIKDIGQVRTSPRTIFRVDMVDGDITVEDKVLAPGDKLPAEWSLSKVSASKLAYQRDYATYKSNRTALEQWVKDGCDTGEEEAEAA